MYELCCTWMVFIKNDFHLTYFIQLNEIIIYSNYVISISNSISILPLAEKVADNAAS